MADAGHPPADLRSLATSAWQLHREAERTTDVVVRPSMPILYFGDLDAYRASPLRVATVGLNPSGEEFPFSDPWRRFPEAQTLDAADVDVDSYLLAMNRYFKPNRSPYMRWFGMAFAAVLRGLDASYSEGAANTAVHTDLCSPVATDPTWSGLSRRDRDALDAGYALWHELIRALQPHVILMSVAERHLDNVTLPFDGRWEPVHVIDRARPYEFRARRVRAPAPCLLVWGRAAQLPFGSVSALDKETAGAAIRRLVG